MKASILLYEDIPEYGSWLKQILGGILALTFILRVVFFFIDTEAGLALFGITVFNTLLFRAILPRRFQIFEDRLKVLVGGPFAINIPFSNIIEAKAVTGRKAFYYSGLRFATSTRGVVEIVRKKGMNMVISPRNDDMFMEQLNQARQLPSA